MKNKSFQKSTVGLLSAALNQSSGGWKSGVLLPALISTCALLAAFPSVNFYPVAWLAPLGWLLVCKRTLPVGRRGYWALWLSGCLFWLVTLHSVRLAFWALYAGWIALSLYLAIYIPLFVGATRLLVHRWKIPLWLAAPVSWIGLELIRSHLLTGYAANTLAHSQAFQPITIQVVDHLGTGGLSFLMVMFSAMLLSMRLNWTAGKRRSAAALFVATVGIVLCVVGYGAWRLRQADRLAAENPVLLRCLLLQENTPSIFEMNPDRDKYADRAQKAWTSYANLCRQAARQWPDLDLVVWPESTFTATTPSMQLSINDEPLPQSLQQELDTYQMTRADLTESIAHAQNSFQLKVRLALRAGRGLDPLVDQPVQPEKPGPDLLVGCDHVQYAPEAVHRYNSAIWIQSDGTIADMYHKMHLVVFGEYIPLRPLLGWLEGLFSFAGAEAGAEPKSLSIRGVGIAPNICFESMLTRLIRRQVHELRTRGSDPDVLINLTNDSWFKGTSMLDHHLASSILCCVENRRPMLIAANTGITAQIDGAGRVLQSAPRLTAQAILAEPRRDGRPTLVQAVGYPLSWLCAAITVLSFVLPRKNLPAQAATNS